ncbi:MAG: DNA polymerase III subunit delta [Verrucomicrobiia bacterium]
MVNQSAYFITGSDELQVKQRAKKLCEQLSPQNEWALEILDGWVETADATITILGKTLEALQTSSLLGDKRLVWLKNATFLSDLPFNRSDAVQEAVEALIGLLEKREKGILPGTLFLLSAPKPDKRRTTFKQLEKFCQTELFDLPATGQKRNWENQAAHFVETLFKNWSKRIDPRAVDAMVQLCGSDHRLLQQEAEKVYLYSAQKSQITLNDVEQMISPSSEESLWAWCDAVVENRFDRAIVLLRQLQFQEENPMGLLVNLAHHIRLVVQCRILLDKKWLMPSSGYTVKWKSEAETIFTRNAEGKLPTPFRIARVAHQAAKQPFSYWLDNLETIFQAYFHFFEGGTEPYQKLELLLLQLDLSSAANELA